MRAIPKDWTPISTPISTSSNDLSGWEPVSQPMGIQKNIVPNSSVEKLLTGISPLSQPAIAKYVPGMAAGLGTGIQNVYNNMAPLINKMTGSNLQPSKTNLYNTLGVPQSDQQGFGNFLNKTAQYAPLMFAPELAPEAGESALINNLGAPAARISNQLIGGALLSQHPAQGAETFGGIQAGLEAVSPLLKTVMWPLHYAAEKINPIGAAKNFISNLSQKYSDTKNAINQAYSYMKPYGDNLIFNPTSAPAIKKSFIKGFPYDLRNSVQNFLVKPTLDAGHSLQSDMFKVANTMKQKAVLQSDRDDASELMGRRQIIVNAIKNKLNDLDPVAAKNYQTGADLTRDVLPTLTPTKLMTEFATGATKSAQPARIVSDYNRAVGKNLIDPEDPNDFISQTIPSLAHKEEMGHFYQEAIPSSIGTTMGFLHGDPLIGGVAGGYFGRSTEPFMIKSMLQNEALHNSLKGLGLKTRAVLKYAVPSVIGNVLNPSNSNSLNNMPQTNTQ